MEPMYPRRKVHVISVLSQLGQALKTGQLEAGMELELGGHSSWLLSTRISRLPPGNQEQHVAPWDSGTFTSVLSEPGIRTMAGGEGSSEPGRHGCGKAQCGQPAAPRPAHTGDTQDKPPPEVCAVVWCGASAVPGQDRMSTCSCQRVSPPGCPGSVQPCCPRWLCYSLWF